MWLLLWLDIFCPTRHYRGVLFIHIQGFGLHHYIVKYVTREGFTNHGSRWPEKPGKMFRQEHSGGAPAISYMCVCACVCLTSHELQRRVILKVCKCVCDRILRQKIEKG